MSISEITKLESRWRENPQGLTFAPLAEAYRKQRDPVRALEILRPGLETHPNYIPASIVLGRCHVDLHDEASAEAAFLHVLSLDGENVIALRALADITERDGRFEESERWLKQLLAVDRSNEEARDQLRRVEGGRSRQEHEPLVPDSLVAVDARAEKVPSAEVAGVDAPARPAPADPAPAIDGSTVDLGPALSFIELPDARPGILDEAPMPSLLIDDAGDELSLERSEEIELHSTALADRMSATDELLLTPPEMGAPPLAALPADGYLAEPEPIVTETMAELCMQQGHHAEALRIYRELVTRSPGDARLERKAAELESAAATAHERSAYSASDGPSQSVAQFFRSVLSARPGALAPSAAQAAPAPQGAGVSAARAPGPTPTDGGESGTRGAPTRPAADHLSLSTVFGDDPAPARRSAAAESGAAPPSQSDVSFDEFFGGVTGTDASPGAELRPARPRRADDDDLEQFHAWLQNLKR